MKAPATPLPWSEDLRDGDPAARERFLESHVDLVRYLALRIASRLPASVDVDDLVHDGIVGLIDAFEKYDPSRAVRFRTYAESRVRGAILDGLRQKDWRPRSVRLLQRDLDATVGRLTTERGRPVEEQEIAGAMGLSLPAYRGLLQDIHAGPVLSLDELPPNLDPPETGEPMLPGTALERRELIESLAAEIGDLPERERRVIELYYHEQLNMKEVGAVLGVTESRVCQLHAQAAARLRGAVGRRLHATPAPRARAAGGGRRGR